MSLAAGAAEAAAAAGLVMRRMLYDAPKRNDVFLITCAAAGKYMIHGRATSSKQLDRIDLCTPADD